jgi:hypothetical protein
MRHFEGRTMQRLREQAGRLAMVLGKAKTWFLSLEELVVYLEAGAVRLEMSRRGADCAGLAESTRRSASRGKRTSEAEVQRLAFECFSIFLLSLGPVARSVFGYWSLMCMVARSAVGE